MFQTEEESAMPQSEGSDRTLHLAQWELDHLHERVLAREPETAETVCILADSTPAR
jgi:hypothetical protein